MGASWADRKSKDLCFEASSSLSLHNNRKSFLNWIVMCNEKWILHSNWWQPTQWLDQKETPKHFPKLNLCQKKKKKSWSLFGSLLPIWSTTAFWILVKPLYLRSMLSKSMRCTQNCKAYCQYRSTERAQFFSMTMLNHITQPMLRQLNKLKFWLSFASTNIFTWPLATQLPFLQASW